MTGWKWVPSTEAFTKLGYLTRLVEGGRIYIDIYGSGPPDKDNEPLCREVARKLDAFDKMRAALEAVWSQGSRGTLDDGTSVSYLVEEALKEAGFYDT